MRSLLDTHFLLWIVSGSTRLDEFAWLEGYRPWAVSPISLLEVTYLAEVGRLHLDDVLTDRVLDDPRFVVDDISSLRLVRHAEPLGWTRDPFDRLLAAHSAARRVPLCTLDETILANHPYIPAELRG